MNRRINAAGLVLVKQWEGLKTRSRDVGGIWTIGYGHTSAGRTLDRLQKFEHDSGRRDKEGSRRYGRSVPRLFCRETCRVFADHMIIALMAGDRSSFLLPLQMSIGTIPVDAHRRSNSKTF
ncbi:UNVERIFIED_ORG: hypothetical protein J2W85_004122 [Ensifer adhaerens]|nr:hypothetical protein [Ensifer sp. Root142]MDP9632039.1 hypothetical protein [Ensifer adhaerens]